MAHRMLQALEAMASAKSLLAELVGHPSLSDDLAERVRKERDALSRQIDSLVTWTGRPADAPLLAYVMSASGLSERGAQTRIATRRSVFLCEWCGQRPPEQSESRVYTCKTCAPLAAAAGIGCPPTDSGGVVDDVRVVERG